MKKRGTFTELKRLRDEAAKVDRETLLEFEAWEFNDNGYLCGGYSPQLSEYLAYAANYAVQIAEDLIVGT